MSSSNTGYILRDKSGCLVNTDTKALEHIQKASMSSVRLAGLFRRVELIEQRLTEVGSKLDILLSLNKLNGGH